MISHLTECCATASHFAGQHDSRMGQKAKRKGGPVVLPESSPRPMCAPGGRLQRGGMQGNGSAAAAPRVLGQMLLRAGAISEAQLAEALAAQRVTRQRLGELLVQRGADPEQVARALAAQLRLPYAEPPLHAEPDAVALVERALALRRRVLPLAVAGPALRLAMADPLDGAAVDDVRFQTGRRVEAVVAAAPAVEAALAAAYGADAVAEALGRLRGRAAGVDREEGGDGDAAALRVACEAPPIVALVDLVLERAIGAGASDVHIQPAQSGLRVRARVDGALRELLELPQNVGAAVVSRIKVMAGLDIAVKRRPQDGRAHARAAGRSVGLRVSTLPLERGEKVVIRLLDAANAGRALADLGLEQNIEQGLLRLLARGQGVVLVTGPTGSGKTTTLYAALAALDRDRHSLVTIEDPVEYRLAGLSQVQVHRKAGLTFAAALRAVLRQDPDVVMLGEMRDRETVEVGMAAALTGHLVLSTLHTNDAPGAVARLLEMRAAPYLIAGGLTGVLAQRLARRLCVHCRREAPAPLDRLRELGIADPPARLFVPGGCARCDDSGFRGRVALAELLVVDPRVRELVLRRAGTDAIREAAVAAGMRPLAADAWRRVREGVTALDEVAPLLALAADETRACDRCGTALRAAFRACPGCGAALQQRCRCGGRLQPGWQFCTACGEPTRQR